MIPAHALAAELRSRNHGVLLITDVRGAGFPGLFDGVPVRILPAGRLSGGAITWLKALGAVVRGRGEAKRLYLDHEARMFQAGSAEIGRPMRAPANRAKARS